jgi:steroid 5-alpha reductase family enzyme
MISSPGLWVTGWLAAAIVMLGFWAQQRARRNATAVDFAWAANLGLLALFFACMGDAPPARRALLALIAGAWSLRLSLHLLFDRVLGKEEDGRYRALRASWGDKAQRNFFLFYQAQALLDAILALPFLLIARNPARAIAPVEFAGAALLVLALAGESLADRQLAHHRADPGNRGRTCRAGLWRFSRHPNYFFEWLNWCAFALVALPAPLGWLGLLSPALMLYLVLRVTGIPPSEARALESRGEDYRDYQRTTSAFFPWFPGGSRPAGAASTERRSV